MNNTVRHRLPLPRAIAPTLAAATAAAAVLTSPSSACGDVFTVPAGTTYTVDVSATHGTNDIRGTLILPSGKTFGAERNWFGRTGNAVIDIQGGAYGTHTGNDGNGIEVGEEGGSASVADTYASEYRKLFGANAELAREAVEWFTGVRLVEKRQAEGVDAK